MRFTSLIDTTSLPKRYIIHQGGTSSTKTWTNLTYLLLYAIKHKVLASVVAESLPHLKRGALRDFINLLKDADFKIPYTYNKSEQVFSFPTTGSNIEFFPADDDSKLRGGRRDILFINECNNVSFEAFQELDVRTKIKTILDFNPVSRFWVHDKLMPSLRPEDFEFRISTYRDAIDAENKSVLPQSIIDNIERRRGNVNWWKVYGEGEVGALEGLVFNNWAIVNDMPAEAKLLGYGIDFGFVNSPTVIVDVRELHGEIYVDELCYKTGMHNEDIMACARANKISLTDQAVADSAEPKTISALYRMGWKGLRPAVKGTDSVTSGLNLMTEKKINVTKRSLNTITELRNYMWDTDREGHSLNKPIKAFDHAIDAIRYLYAYPRKRKLVFA